MRKKISLNGNKSVMNKLFFNLSVCLAATSSYEAIAHSTFEEITVFGRQVNLVGEAISASEGRVSQEELSVRPMLRSGEVLEVVPGMVATQHSGSGKANQYFLRGFNLDHGTDFATFIDGMPINMRSHGHGQGYTDLNFIIPELVHEVVYKKGSYYADVGDFSGTGSAHLTTTSQLDADKLSLGIGEEEFGRILIFGDNPVGEGNLLYGFEHQVYDGPWQDISEDVEKTNIWLKQSWSTDKQQFVISLMAYDNTWNSADQIPERAVASGAISKLGSLDTTVGGESSRYSLSGHWSRQYDKAQLKADIYVINYDMNLWSNFSYFTNPGGDQFQQVDQRNIYGWNFASIRAGEVGNHMMTNTWGTQFRLDDIDEVGLLQTVSRSETGVVRVDAVKQHNISVYWENEIHWTDRLRSIIGLRYDYFDFDVDTLQAGDTSTLALNEGTNIDDIFTSSISINYALASDYETYISVGQGFHSNDARGTTIKVDPTNGDPIQPVDPLVDTLGYEVGIRAFVTDKLNASIALWHLDIDSELIFVGDEGTTEDTGIGSKRDGIELTAYYYFNDQWILDFEYAYTDARLDKKLDGSDTIAGALETVVSAGIHRVFSERVYSHIRFRYFGDYPLDSGERADSSTLVNLRVGYTISNKADISLDVLNLLDSDDHDVEYFYESQLADEPSPVGDKHFHVFEPRSFRANISYKF